VGGYLEMDFTISGNLLAAQNVSIPPSATQAAPWRSVASWEVDTKVFKGSSTFHTPLLASSKLSSTTQADQYGTYVSGNSNGLYKLYVAVGYDQALTIDIDAFANADALLRQGGLVPYSVADLSHTVSWGGMTLYDNSFNPITTGFTAISPTTGFDYALPAPPEVAAVPETSTWAMMLGGFAGLGFAGYRRNKAATLVA
jgi:hypothetical protein